MTSRVVVLCALLACSAGCDGLPGRPQRADRPVRPSSVTDFATLYGENCAGCHGDERAPGAAVSLRDPVYLALVDQATLHRVTSVGVAGTAMPGFARSAGGALTDEQIDVIVRGLGGPPERLVALGASPPPPYAAPPGDADRGRKVYATFCASCHGPTGEGGAHGGSVVDGSYLALVSDQGLRSAVLFGRPALGMPNWLGGGKGPAMSAQDVADVVAWMIGKRVALPGRPYATAERADG